MLFWMSSYRTRLYELPNSDGTISSDNRIRVCGTKVWAQRTHRPNNYCSAPLAAFKSCWVSASSGGSSCFGIYGRLLKEIWDCLLQLLESCGEFFFFGNFVILLSNHTIITPTKCTLLLLKAQDITICTLCLIFWPYMFQPAWVIFRVLNASAWLKLLLITLY
jgi:hypothetical protein